MNETFAWIKSRKTGLAGMTVIKWNFEKALIGRDGEMIERYSSLTKPVGAWGALDSASTWADETHRKRSRPKLRRRWMRSRQSSRQARGVPAQQQGFNAVW